MRKRYILIIFSLFLLILFPTSCSDSDNISSAIADINIMDNPDKELLGGWRFVNPENSSELIAFEFGPDSTVVIINYSPENQGGQKITGKCVYLTVNDSKAIEITLDSTDGMKLNYYYSINNKEAEFVNAENGEIMVLELVKEVKFE